MPRISWVLRTKGWSWGVYWLRLVCRNGQGKGAGECSFVGCGHKCVLWLCVCCEMICKFALWFFSGLSNIRVRYEKKAFILATLYVSKVTSNLLGSLFLIVLRSENTQGMIGCHSGYQCSLFRMWGPWIYFGKMNQETLNQRVWPFQGLIVLWLGGLL